MCGNETRNEGGDYEVFNIDSDGKSKKQFHDEVRDEKQRLIEKYSFGELRRLNDQFEPLLFHMIASDTEYTIRDLHDVLTDENSRDDFVEDIDSLFVAEYLQGFDEWPSDEFSTLIRKVEREIRKEQP